MSWAQHYIAKLKAGEEVSFRPRGNSMVGKVESGQLCTVAPITDHSALEVGDIVLCKVGGSEYLHLIKNDFDTHGYLVTAALFDESACQIWESNLTAMPIAMAGNRNLLASDWCATLAQELKNHPLLAQVLPQSCVAVQCTLFEKSLDRNWLVALHQDLSIPVAEKIDHPGLSGWAEKEGGIFVQPPIELLQQLVALRLHIDDCAVSDGPLKVVPGSHLHGRVSQGLAQSLRSNNGEVICPVARGAVMIMQPLLLHASSKATGQSRRRVLHFLFAPKTLPFGLRWHHAV